MRHDYYSRGYFFQRLDGAIFFNNQLPTRERCHARPAVIYYTFDENELMHAGFRASSRRPRVIYFVRWREWKRVKRVQEIETTEVEHNGLDRPMNFRSIEER